MVCNISVETFEDGFGFVEWLTLNIFICNVCLYSMWRRDWFKSIAVFNVIPITQTIFFGMMTIVAVANSWAAFALWHCNNWDAKFLPLLLNVLMVVFVYGFPLIVMVTREASAYLLWSMAAIGLSAGFIGTAWKYDIRAAGVGFVDLAFALFFFVFAVSAWMNNRRIVNHHDGKTDKQKVGKARFETIPTIFDSSDESDEDN